MSDWRLTWVGWTISNPVFHDCRSSRTTVTAGTLGQYKVCRDGSPGGNCACICGSHGPDTGRADMSFIDLTCVTHSKSESETFYCTRATGPRTTLHNW